MPRCHRDLTAQVAKSLPVYWDEKPIIELSKLPLRLPVRPKGPVWDDEVCRSEPAERSGSRSHIQVLASELKPSTSVVKSRSRSQSQSKGKGTFPLPDADCAPCSLVVHLVSQVAAGCGKEGLLSQHDTHPSALPKASITARWLEKD